MHDFHEALECVLQAARPLPTHTVAGADAYGCVLGADVFTPRPFPDTPRSAVDGYALGQLGRKSYSVRESLAAGALPHLKLNADEASAVMTGATVPHPCEAVVRVEDTAVQAEQVQIKAPVTHGSNINTIGEEAQPGTLIMERGRLVTEIDFSVLCYAGLKQLCVYRKPKIGLLITGSELLQPGAEHQPGKTYNSNSYLLQSVLTRLGMECEVCGPLEDDLDTLQEALTHLGTRNDVVVSSGGVSMGKYDHVRPLLQREGFSCLVERTRIKPGRPLIVSQRDETLFFGMPGYPAAFLTNLFAYLLPVLKKMAGWHIYGPTWHPVRLLAPARGRKGRCDFVRVKLTQEAGQLCAQPLPSQMTSHYLNMAACDALLLLDSVTDNLPQGALGSALIFKHELC